MKYRLVKRAKGWQVQQDTNGLPGFESAKWFNIRGGMWRFRLPAALHFAVAEGEGEEMTDAEESAEVEAAVKKLGEHFDAVVILCSRHDGTKGTRTIAKGSGNWHTQYGIVREWMVNHDEDVRIQARRDVE